MRVPIFFSGQSLIDAIVKVFVVGKENVATDIVKLHATLALTAPNVHFLKPTLTNPSGVTSVEAKPPGVSFESTIIHDGPSCNCYELDGEFIFNRVPYQLM